MKKHILTWVILIPILFFNSCTKEEDKLSLKGLVSFAENPTYSSNTITFRAQIQFGGLGRPTEIEYQLLESGEGIFNGRANASSNPDGMGIWFETGQISVDIPLAEYSGSVITIWLDPDNKITLPEYTTQVSVDLWKKESVNIP